LFHSLEYNKQACYIQSENQFIQAASGIPSAISFIYISFRLGPFHQELLIFYLSNDNSFTCLIFNFREPSSEHDLVCNKITRQGHTWDNRIMKQIESRTWLFQVILEAITLDNRILKQIESRTLIIPGDTWGNYKMQMHRIQHYCTTTWRNLRNSIYNTSLCLFQQPSSHPNPSHRFWVCTSLSFSATIATEHAWNILICYRCSGIKKIILQNKSDQTGGELLSIRAASRGTAVTRRDGAETGEGWQRAGRGAAQNWRPEVDGRGLGKGRCRTGPVWSWVWRPFVSACFHYIGILWGGF
jgi:hypothetical protein